MFPGIFSNSASKIACTLSCEIYSENFPQYSILRILKFSIICAEHLSWHKMYDNQMKWSLGLSSFYKLFWCLWKLLNFPFHENCPYIVFMAAFISHLRAPKHACCIFYDAGILILFNPYWVKLSKLDTMLYLPGMQGSLERMRKWIRF